MACLYKEYNYGKCSRVVAQNLLKIINSSGTGVLQIGCQRIR